MRRPVVQLKDLAISPIYSPKLTLPARQGRRVVLWAGSRGCGRLRARVPVPVRVQAAALRKASGHGVATKPVSSSGLFILALCWLSSVIGVVSFFTAATGACMMLDPSVVYLLGPDAWRFLSFNYRLRELVMYATLLAHGRGRRRRRDARR